MPHYLIAKYRCIWILNHRAFIKIHVLPIHSSFCYHPRRVVNVFPVKKCTCLVLDFSVESIADISVTMCWFETRSFSACVQLHTIIFWFDEKQSLVYTLWNAFIYQHIPYIIYKYKLNFEVFLDNSSIKINDYPKKYVNIGDFCPKILDWKLCMR